MDICNIKYLLIGTDVGLLICFLFNYYKLIIFL